MDIIITHSDFDGIFTAALFLQKADFGADIIISNSAQLSMSFKSIENRNFRNLYVGDIPVSMRASKRVIASVKKLIKKGVNIYYYDHHPWDNDALSFMRNNAKVLVVNTNYKTAAALFFEKNLKEHAYSNKIMKMLYHKYDREDEDASWYEDWLYLLSSSQRDHINPNFLTLVIRKLGYNKKFSGSDRKKIQKEKEIQREQQKFIDGEHPVFTTKKGKKLVLVDLRGKKFDQTTAMDILRKKNYDIYISLFSQTRLQIGVSKRSMINLSILRDVKEIDKTKYNINGHDFVMAVKYRLSFISIVKSIFSSDYPTEMKAFVNFIAKNF